MSTLSRYIKIVKTRIKKEKRVRALRGAGDDSNKLFRCWNCGFTCNTDRDIYGDTASENPLSYRIYPINQTHSGRFQGLGATLIGDNGDAVLMKLDANGNIVSTNPHNYFPVVSVGCPFCGTLNWK